MRWLLGENLLQSACKIRSTRSSDELDAVAFLFCSGTSPVAAEPSVPQATVVRCSRAVVTVTTSSRTPRGNGDEAADDERCCGEVARITTHVPHRCVIPAPALAPGLPELPPLDFGSAVVALLPLAAVAANGVDVGFAATATSFGGIAGGATAAPMMLACVPLAVPFAVPEVRAQAWSGSKRAVAFHRSTVVAVYLQGFLALRRFLHGDLTGGAYDLIQACVGGYALQPDCAHIMPTYVLASGLAGSLGMLRTYWNFMDLPLRYMPISPYLAPGVAIVAAYCGYKFCVEVRSLAMGYPGGTADSCFIRLLGAEWCGWSAIGGVGTRDPHVEAFAGLGQRLGTGR
eukprot:TRINITY_DN20294_c0_g2_i1.p1 TRINITY_DN20294_c0_g2~~TRINITY_DN20294_c0_g2_i1.p1  ORF type:complete len:344 (-),score=53.90 TRINITY_DN20294_c0_g2_i1:89-1120(-)